MPLKPGKSSSTVSENIRELHKGKTYRSTKTKYGKKKANDQAVAIALAKAGKKKRNKGVYRSSKSY